MHRILYFLFAISIISCTESTTTKTTTPKAGLDKEACYGIWEGVSFNVIVNSFENNADSSFVFEVNEADWEQKLQVKPVKTIYLPDSTYIQEFHNLAGDMYDQSKGLWNTYGDTLLLLERDATYTYDGKIKTNGLLELRSLVDWDGDGQEDDEYTATHRLIGRDVRKYQ